MKELYELKEKLVDELKGYGKKEMSAGSLDVIDKLAHATKNLCKVIESEEDHEGYSNRYVGRGHNNMVSYGRDNRGRGVNAKRDSMGRYSSNNSYEGGDGNSYYEGDMHHPEMMRDGYYDPRR